MQQTIELARRGEAAKANHSSLVRRDGTEIPIDRAVLRMYESEIDSHGLTVQTDLEAGRHHVNGDLGRLQQAFWNILKNAAEHTPEGGRIAVRTFNADATLCVSFTDTGVGMSAETLQRDIAGTSADAIELYERETCRS